MKRILICCAAIAFLAVDQTETAAQSGARTGSYQSILSNSGAGGFNAINGGVGAYNQGAYNQFGNGTTFQGTAMGYQQPLANPSPTPMMNSTYQPQSYPVDNTPAATTQPIGVPQAPAAQATPNDASSACSTGSCDVGGYAASSGFVGSGAGCDSPVYMPGNNIGCAPVAPARTRNWFYGLNGLVFNRDFEDDVFLTRNPAGDRLLSTDADSNTLGGLEFFLGSRNSCGNGWEARYWGLFNDEATATLTGVSHDTYLTDLSGLIWPTSGEDLATVFNRGTSNTITRDNEFHNVEFNFLRQGGCFRTRFGQCANFELLHGFRWFEFNEEFHWDITSAVAPNSIFFDTDVRNTLLGYQIGSRSNICFGRRMTFNVGTTAGVFNNRARLDQSIIDDAGVYATVGAGGPDYNFSDSKNDIAFLGQLDLGVGYLITQCSRINIGYRALGVSGVALAPDQFSNFNTVDAIRDIQTNGSLLLHGAYFGFEFCR